MPQEFKYHVEATVWAVAGSGRTWRGQATISQRADSSMGLSELQHAAAKQADAWLRTKGETPANRVDLTVWYPIPAPTQRRRPRT